MNLWIAMFLEISSPWGCTQQTEGLPGRLQALAPVPGFHSGSGSTHQFISTATGGQGAIADTSWRESTCWGVSVAIETNTQRSTSIHWENAEMPHRNVTKGTPTPCPQWQEVWVRLSTSLHHWQGYNAPVSRGYKTAWAKKEEEGSTFCAFTQLSTEESRNCQELEGEKDTRLKKKRQEVEY